MKTASALNFYFCLLVCLALSATVLSKHDSEKQNYIIMVYSNKMFTFDAQSVADESYGESSSTHSLGPMTNDPINGTILIASDGAIYDSRWNRIHNSSYVGICHCLAFDYFGNNVYMGMNSIIIVHSLSTGEKISISPIPWHNGIIKNIVLIPEEGYEQRRSSDMIYRMQMNGLGIPMNVTNSTIDHSRVTLAHDRNNKRIFFSDHINKRIESVDYQGGDRRVFRSFHSRITRPFYIAILENKIFWIPEYSFHLYWAHLDKKEIALGAQDQDIDFHRTTVWPRLYSIESFKDIDNIDNYTRELHPCRRNNGDCSHVCLVNDTDNRLCACPWKFKLDTDMKTCISIYAKYLPYNTCSNLNSWIGLVVGLLSLVIYWH